MGAPKGKPARHVLLVDPNAPQREIIAARLRRAGYQVSESGSGHEALRLCRHSHPDFVMSAAVMPSMSGIELCRAFRAIDRPNRGYFILLSTRSEKCDISHALSAGVDDFLNTPISRAELMARLNAGERILKIEEELRASNEMLRATLGQLRTAQDAMDRDLREARKLQQGLVRERSGRFSDVEMSLLLRPAGHIGGDLVGFFPIDDARVGIYALDVSGHGVTAALLTAQLSVHLSGSADQNVAVRAAQLGNEPVSPAALAHFFNNMMLEEMSTDTYFTMIYAELNHRTGAMQLVQAGHPHPVIQRGDGRVERIGSGGMPIGVFERPIFDEVELMLEPGDRLLITSDGLVEAANPAGQLLGEEGLDAVMRTNAFLTGHAFLESMAWSVSEYCKGQRLDDISAVLIEHRRPASPITLSRG